MNDLRSLWNYGDPAGSEARFDAFLEGELEPDLRAEALTQKARAQGLQRRFDEARLTLAEAFQLLSEEPSSGQVAYWLELGRVERSSGNKAAAEPHFIRALELAQRVGNEFLAVDAAHMVGVLLEGDESLKWNLKAIELAEAATDPKARNWLGTLFNNVGWSQYALGRYPEALEYFEKALAFRRTQGNPENIRIAQFCYLKGLRSVGRVLEALDQQQDLAQEVLDAGGEPGFQWEEIGECLLLLDRANEARPYFKKAYDVLSKDAWIAADEPKRLERLLELSS